MNVDEMKSDYDWREAWGVAQAPEAVLGFTGSLDLSGGWDNVVVVLAAAAGENDGNSWVAALRLHDGRHLLLSAWCDYTGWDCQSGGRMQISASLDDLIRFGMTGEERTRLGYTLE